MAKTQTSIPPVEFTHVFEPTDAESAFEAISDDDKRDGGMFLVPFDAIHPVKDFNIRVHTPDYEAHIERIVQSITDNGFFRHMPLKVHPVSENGQNLLYLAGGYSRYEAAKRAVANGVKLTRLPVVPTKKGTTMADLLIGLDRDNDGLHLTPFEKGILVKRMSNADESEDEIAAALGITKQYVNDLLSLMGAPKPLHNMIVSGEVAANLAVELYKEHESWKKVVEVLKGAGATGTSNGAAGPPATRVTRQSVTRTGGTAKFGKKHYESLIEYLIVLNSGSGPQTAIDWLIRYHEGDKDALKELAAVTNKPKGRKKTAVDKDTRIPIKKSMSEDEKAKARKHNKRVKLRAEKAAAAAAAAAAGTPTTEQTDEDDPI